MDKVTSSLIEKLLVQVQFKKNRQIGRDTKFKYPAKIVLCKDAKMVIFFVKLYWPTHSELELYFCVGFSWERLQVTHIVFAYHWTS